MLKVLRCAGNEDSITLRAKDDTDSMEVFIENTDQDRTSTFEIKLMDLDQERLGIPVSHVMSCAVMLHLYISYLKVTYFHRYIC